MSTLVLLPQGRYGNQTLQFLYAYAFAQRHGMTFACDPWIGEQVFALPKYERPFPTERPRWSENDLIKWEKDWGGDWPWEGEDIEYRGYAQQQGCMIYTKRWAQAWLKLRPDVEAKCPELATNTDRIVFHRRVGDLIGYGYPVISRASYKAACELFGLDWELSVELSEENPTPHTGLPDDLSFLPDFYRMMHAPTLLRANSSFSWLAALLGNGLVLSPVIEGLEGGREHHCRFTPGNWPRFANLDFTTDLHVTA